MTKSSNVFSSLPPPPRLAKLSMAANGSRPTDASPSRQPPQHAPLQVPVTVMIGPDATRFWIHSHSIGADVDGFQYILSIDSMYLDEGRYL
jgi:hypothetical protein